MRLGRAETVFIIAYTNFLAFKFFRIYQQAMKLRNGRGQPVKADNYQRVDWQRSKAKELIAGSTLGTRRSKCGKHGFKSKQTRNQSSKTIRKALEEKGDRSRARDLRERKNKKKKKEKKTTKSNPKVTAFLEDSLDALSEKYKMEIR